MNLSITHTDKARHIRSFLCKVLTCTLGVTKYSLNMQHITMDFIIGDKVQGVDELGRWEEGKVVSADAETQGTVNLEFVLNNIKGSISCTAIPFNESSVIIIWHQLAKSADK